MPDESKILPERSYLNPVYPHSFPDPYILKYRGEYYAYCTGYWHDGRIFGILHSRNLVNWREIGGAMHKLESDAPFYWAPEVSYYNGKFYLYYSVGNEVLMHLRVAVSDRPDGGFIDSGKRLTSEDFAIDAHVFTDDDGVRYMFYATDFLEHAQIGTGTVVDRMVDWYTLAGNPKPVTRAKYDWQVYDPHRIEKGGVRWYTVEGPFILKHKDIYFEMFSGGNWQNVTYGVSFAVTDNLEQTEEWEQFSDGEKVLPILRTLPGKVIGPGHNSVVRGPNNRELYCIYHRWTDDGRVLAIDRMDFAGPRLFVNGPTYKPQIAPFQPSVNDHFNGNTLSENWTAVGEWSVTAGEAVSGTSGGEQRLICDAEADSFLCEVSVRAIKIPDEPSFFGLGLLNKTETIANFLIDWQNRAAILDVLRNGSRERTEAALPDEFVPDAIHLVRIDVDRQFLKISLDEKILFSVGSIDPSPKKIALLANGIEVAFSGFALTGGFEDLFETNDDLGWHTLDDKGRCYVENKLLSVSSKTGEETKALKMQAVREYDFAVNIRLDKSRDEFAWGFVFIDHSQKEYGRISIRPDGAGCDVKVGRATRNLPLPQEFSAQNFHQFGVLVKDGRLHVRMEDAMQGEFTAPRRETRFGIFCKNATVNIDMARLTVL